MQTNEVINDAKESLHGLSLKLCTFKVGEQIRGRKIGELFLKAAFRFATDNRCENIFVHTSDDQFYLLELLSDFGFQRRGMYGTDIMLVKAHPSSPPVEDVPALDYARLYFPHYRKKTRLFRNFLYPFSRNTIKFFSLNWLVKGSYSAAMRWPVTPSSRHIFVRRLAIKFMLGT